MLLSVVVKRELSLGSRIISHSYLHLWPRAVGSHWIIEITNPNAWRDWLNSQSLKEKPVKPLWVSGSDTGTRPWGRTQVIISLNWLWEHLGGSRRRQSGRASEVWMVGWLSQRAGAYKRSLIYNISHVEHSSMLYWRLRINIWRCYHLLAATELRPVHRVN